MKKLVICMVLVLLTLVGCSSVKKGEVRELDGVKIYISSLKTDFNKNTGSTIFYMKFKIENNTDKEISSVTYKKEHLAKDGHVIRDFIYVWLAENDPLQPGETVEEEFDWQEVMEEEIDTIQLSIDSYTTQQQSPTIQLPKIGEPLYLTYGDDHLAKIKDELPVKMNVVIDHMGAQEFVEITDQNTIQEFVDAFVKITIASETDEYVTDNYNSVSFTFQDGTEVYLSLNLTNLEVTCKNKQHLYTMDNFKQFWQLCNEYADYPN